MSAVSGSASWLVALAGYHNSVSTWRVNPDGSAVTAVAESDGGHNPSYMALHKESGVALAVNESADGTVTSFKFDAAAGTLAKVSIVTAKGDDPCHVLIHPTGRWAFISNYSSGTLTTLAIGADGKLAEHDSFSPGKNVHQAQMDATGTRLFVPCLGSDHVAQFDFDVATGKLTPNATAAAAALPAGAGPRHLAWHPSRQWAYVINELNSTMTRFAYDAAAGVLKDGVHVSTVPTGTDLAGKSTAHVLVSPDGRFVYGSNRGHDSIVIYSVNPDDGTLTTVGWETGAGDVRVPRDFELSPDGSLVVVANQAADSFTVFTRDAASGALHKVATHALPAGRKPCFVGFW